MGPKSDEVVLKVLNHALLGISWPFSCLLCNVIVCILKYITNEMAELQELKTNLEIFLPHCAYGNNPCYVIVIYEGPFMYLVKDY